MTAAPLQDQPGRRLFSILIPTWNNLDYLKLCIASIKKNSRFPHQVVLHVNEGTDGTREWAKAEQLDHTTSEVNIGVCRAVNMAFSLADADYVVYMNDDMYVCPDWDFYLWEEISKAPNNLFFFSATTIEPEDMGKKCALAPYPFGRSPKDFDESRLLATFASLPFRDWNGASWPPNVVHRQIWQLVGGYSTEYFPGFYSDPDFALKLWHAGIRNFKGVAASRAYHFLEISTRKLRSQQVRKANALFVRKWGITARMFNRFYLRMGDPYDGELKDPPRDRSYRLAVLRCRFKNLGRSFTELLSR
jgi:glycosyltransferase involved in cell wall biosynthesis